MTERYNQIEARRYGGNDVCVKFLAPHGEWERHFLSAAQARLLARDLLKASLAISPEPPRADLAPATATANTDIDIDAMRRDMQQLARTVHDIAERVKRLEAKPEISPQELYDQYLKSMPDLPASRPALIGTRYGTGCMP